MRCVRGRSRWDGGPRPYPMAAPSTKEAFEEATWGSGATYVGSIQSRPAMIGCAPRMDASSATPALPGTWAAAVRMALGSDVRHVLAAIRVPTLVVHSTMTSGVMSDMPLLADHIPGVKYVELKGRRHTPGEEVAAAIAEFITGRGELLQDRADPRARHTADDRGRPLTTSSWPPSPGSTRTTPTDCTVTAVTCRRPSSKQRSTLPNRPTGHRLESNSPSLYQTQSDSNPHRHAIADLHVRVSSTPPPANSCAT